MNKYEHTYEDMVDEDEKVISDKDIKGFSAEKLLDIDTIYYVYDQSPEEQARLKALMKQRSREIGIEKDFATVIKSFDKAQKKLAEEYKRENAKREGSIDLDYDSRGNPLTTVDNFVQVLENDEHFKGMQYNELTHSPEQVRQGKVERWTDSDDAETRRYIEKKYHFHSAQKCDDAMRIVFAKHSYNPIKQIIDKLEWDGKPRILFFLHEWGKCPDNPYTREVSRLIFAGGIHRLYSAGCKFDDMPVLVGTRQGEGKSTLVRWLALRDEFFTEVTVFEGSASIEQLSGAWICEVSELLAMTKTKEQEAVKSFLTRIKDKYREPYSRRSEDRLRQCIFIGTTNKEQFLTDKTGNRRFYPVKIYSSGYDLFNHEEECRNYIAQCWAEAKAMYDRHELPAFASRELYDTIREQQAAALEDDYRVGLIESYLEKKALDEVCILELWKNALQNDFSKPTKKDSMEIGLILQGMKGWEKQDGGKRFTDYGYQKYWKRVTTSPDGDGEQKKSGTKENESESVCRTDEDFFDDFFEI